MHRSSRRGLTFIEILIVMIIVGILGLVGFVGWQKSLKDTAQREGEMYLKSTADQLTSYLQTRSTFGSYAQFANYAALNNNLVYYQPYTAANFTGINVVGGVLQNGSTITLTPRNINKCRAMRAVWVISGSNRFWRFEPFGP